MQDYETYKISDITNLKRPTVYFFLKTNGFSEHFIKNLRKNCQSIKINGNFSTMRSQISPSDTLEILKNPNMKNSTPICDGEIDILFEDDDFLIVNKPHNLSCLPTRSHIANNLGGKILNYMLQKDENFVLRVKNRLDREASGIVIVAKNPIAYNNLNSVKKEYHAICERNFEDKNFTINRPILTVTKNGINEIKRIISDDGKPSITHVNVIKNFENTSLLSISLETGRTHQIRLHLSSIGHSLLGDTLYGTPTKENHAFLLLKKVEFTHFRTNKQVKIEVPYPNDWKAHIEK